VARCATCGNRQPASRFCGRCGALVADRVGGPTRPTADPSRTEIRAGRSGRRPTTSEVPRSGSDAAQVATSRGGRARRAFGPAVAAVLALVAVAVVGVTGSGDDADGAGPGGTAPDDTRADEVALPGDGDGDDGSGGDGDGGSGEGADAGTLEGTGPAVGAAGNIGSAGSGRGPGFECLVASGCGWQVDVGDLGASTQRVTRADDGRTLVAAGTAGLAAIDLQGERRWSHEMGGGPGRAEWVVTAGDLVLTVTGSRLVAFDVDSGARRWSTSGLRESHLYPEAAVPGDGATVLVTLVPSGRHPHADPPGYVRAHDTTHGRLRWDEYAPKVLVGSQTVVLVDEDLRGVDAATGEERWRSDEVWSVPDRVGIGEALQRTTIQLAGERVLIVEGGAPDSPTGRVLLDAATGDELRRFDDASVVWARRAGDNADGPQVVLQRMRPPRGLTAIGSDGEVVWERTAEVDGRCCAEARASAEVLALEGPAEGRIVTVDLADGATLHDGHIREASSLWQPLGPRTVLSHDARAGVATATDLVDGRPLWRIRDVVPSLTLRGGTILQIDGQVLGLPWALHDPP
jgi:hypothetical protein